MNWRIFFMKPDFEERCRRHIQMESELEQPLTVRSEAHFMLDDIAEKILSGKGIQPEDTVFLEMLWRELREEDPGIADALSRFRSAGLITEGEDLFASCYFFVSKQIGPESGALRDAIMFRSDPEMFSDIAAGIRMPERTRSALVSIYRKMFGLRTSSEKDDVSIRHHDGSQSRYY